MKKLLMFLLSVMILSVTGCGSTKEVAPDAKAGYEDAETKNDTEAVTTEAPKEEITVEEVEEEGEAEMEIHPLDHLINLRISSKDIRINTLNPQKINQKIIERQE